MRFIPQPISSEGVFSHVVINYYIKNRINNDPSALLSIGSPYRELLVSSTPSLISWEYAPYNKSTDYPEDLIVPAPKGEMMRSKSEASIAQVLYSHGIPYRYEEIHEIYGTDMATDFTIMHPKTGAIILWELISGPFCLTPLF